jgi:hypothetical protein
MPYCPECRDEFQDKVKVCPDCQVELVEKLSSESQQNKKAALICIARAPNEMIATMWKGILEENGINSMLKSVSFMESAQYAHNLFPFDIYVLDSEAEKAKEILTPFLEEE